jgi:hypothetical protein
MTELVSVERMVRTVTTLTGDTPVMGCTRAALLTRAGDRRGAERKSLVRFVDGSYPSRVRSRERAVIGSARDLRAYRVGRAVRESATFQRRDW